MSKQQVREQFGPNAAAYAASKIHAHGASLARLVELLQPQPSWQVLDVATAAGHTALSLAPHVACVVATDLTPEMLPTAARLAQERSLSNVRLAPADAEALPFADDCFHLVTCRIAAHHFPHIGRFVAESARVLRPGGLLAVVDNVVPGSRLGSKKGKRLRQAGRYLNAFEKLRDPSHHRCLSLNEWAEVFYQAGFALIHQETAAKELDFHDWTARMRVSAQNRTRLRAMLVQAPEAVADFLTPHFDGDKIAFRLTEAILIGKQ
jgi:ubiquinone/menaquinone biosynthesis C-methylase UbiE